MRRKKNNWNWHHWHSYETYLVGNYRFRIQTRENPDGTCEEFRVRISHIGTGKGRAPLFVSTPGFMDLRRRISSSAEKAWIMESASEARLNILIFLDTHSRNQTR